MCVSGKIIRREMLVLGKSDKKIHFLLKEVFSHKLVKPKASVGRL